MITESWRPYILELLEGLGPAARHFVLVGAQAMKFMLPTARATRDFDFVLDVDALRTLDVDIAGRLAVLGYQPIEGARYFQFQKPVPESAEGMRIEFLGPEARQQKGDIRVKVQTGLHARGCPGAEVALRESVPREVEGQLPAGKPVTAHIRVTQPWALVLLKTVALDDRYRNIRGPRQREHDRDEAMTHAGDIVAILSANVDAGFAEFRARFHEQLEGYPDLRMRVLGALKAYFIAEEGPGLLLYQELEARQSVGGEQERIRVVVEQAQRLATALVQPPSAEVLLRLPRGDR